MFWKPKSKRIFLDYASGTPVDPEVLSAMKPFFSDDFHNPSGLYQEGVKVKGILKEARTSVARELGVTPEEITFTGSGTESINLALLGAVKASGVEKPHVVTTQIEHSAVLETCKEIEQQGGEVTYLPVNKEGIVNVQDLEHALKDNTVLVSVMYANNEIGTIQPIKKLSRVVRKFRDNKKVAPFFHVDASQAPLYLDCALERMGADMLTLDGLKMYGPKGVGVLAHKRYVDLAPVNFGGGQERGLRSGTENIPGIIGFAKALEKAGEMRESESARLSEIRDYAIEKILKEFPEATLNGSREQRLPNNINICFPGIDAEFTVIKLDTLGIACSFASSCKTLSEDSTSYVVSALGGDCAKSSLRFSMGRDTTKKDIDVLIQKLKQTI